MTKIKICGLMTDEDAEIINQTHPDYAGIVFAPGRHQVNFQQAMRLRHIIDRSIPIVGVFVNAPIDQIIHLYQSKVIQVAQLHGEESPKYIETLHNLGITIINVQIKDHPQINNSQSDYLMIDSGKGSGKTLEWNQLNKLPNQNLFVAGGINCENVKTVIQILKPFAVDVSSGSEKNGHKNLSLIKNLVRVAHEN